MQSVSFQLNAKASPKDDRDYLAKVASTSSRSARSVDLSSTCTSIKDQGPLGSCTAFAGVALIEQFLRANGVSVPEDMLSELFLYYNTRVLVEKSAPSDDSGAYLRSVMTAIQKYGVCLEGQCPYVVNRFSVRPTPTAYTAGLRYQAVKYASIPTHQPTVALQTMKRVLASGQSVIGGILLYDNYESSSRGLIPAPTRQSVPVGGHAVLFVGYDDDRQLFKFKNSWGIGWGDRGYGYLPYSYLTTGNMFDLWTLSAQENNNAIVNQRVIAVPPAVRQASLRQVTALLLQRVSTELSEHLQQGSVIPSQPTVERVTALIPPEHLPNLVENDVRRLVMHLQTVWIAMRQLQNTLKM